jgi:hypothetical protein
MSKESQNLSLRNLRLPTPEAIAKIEAAELEPEDKAWLVAKIKKSGHAGVIMDAHEVAQDGNIHVHASITKLFCVLLLSALALSNVCRADISFSNMVTYASTGGAVTNTSAPVIIGTAYISANRSFLITDGGTASTNALIAYVKYSVGTNGFTTVATYTKTGTNAVEGVVTPAAVSFPIYAEVVFITTNDVAVGAKAVFPQ